MARAAAHRFRRVGHHLAAWPPGGFGPDPGRQFNSLGIIAVKCFLALSGFMIARSGERLTIGRFLWHRTVRISPRGTR
jgi:peptidoglycan/LPS O-acetylase OafA/YrhL